jgi:diguanylate cyclase (GGDEF)-like protein/PAS domain S-box-containing protein
MDIELLYKAFHASPDAILISRLADGRLVEVNDGFSRLFGFGREEALSNTSLQLGLWINPQDRETFIQTIYVKSRIRDYGLDLRKKNGEIISCLVSGEVIQFNDELHGLWVVRDVTERKQVDKILRLRLKLWEYAASNSLNELMQKALDEIEALTGSLVSFYHFVDEDQNNLSLQTWSTRTQDVFCVAEGRGLHYSIQDAGVWVDCVHQRKPVIHNDYASLPHRKGMPEGHATVIRELVVPTMRSGKVVSILGVGNKPSDYENQDIELVSYIADLVWEIVEQKRAAEHIRQLNSQLESLAMTDELTGLMNRRSFFIRGASEIKRVRRYHTPLSLLMLDLDGFKTINDQYGHEIGDVMLQSVAQILCVIVRECDLVARMGGEEFSILLPNTKPKDAENMAERIRLAVEAIECPVPDGIVTVTASIGVSGYSQDVADIDAILRNADAAMYQAKRVGRNRIVMYSGI